MSALFLSTLSLRRATLAGPSGPAFLFNFYPRSPCGERLVGAIGQLQCIPDFYPRSPCGERPGTHAQWPTQQEISIHALLAESDLYDTYAKVLRVNISIHALLAESDDKRCKFSWNDGNFYPRSPCGERPTDMRQRFIKLGFLSTLSLRRATAVQIIIVIVHALFLSTLSLRRATLERVIKCLL